MCSLVRVLLAVLVLCGSTLAVAQTRVQPEQVPAAGLHHAELQVQIGGRYTLRARSASGVALRLTSPLLGPGEWAGEAGVSDGRLDVFLAPGRYRLHTAGDPAASGNVRLQAQPVEELSAAATGDDPLAGAALIELLDAASLSSTLADGQQRSYRIELHDTTTLALEAAGRALADLRLWRDGGWLVPGEPDISVHEAAPGRPLRVARLVTRLPAGRYRLSAYGGVALDWADGGAAVEDSPLHVRRGMPRLPRVYRGRHTVSPFGFDRFLVPRQAERFRLELPFSAPATLRVAAHSTDQPFAETGSVASIDVRSREPLASVQLPRRNELQDEPTAGLDVLTVTYAAGQPYTLQYHPLQHRLRITEPGEYWLESSVPGAARDGVAISALVFRGPRGRRDHKLIDHSALRLHRDAAWTARFNLTRPAEFYLQVQEDGEYLFQPDGAAAAYVVSPYAAGRNEAQARRPDADGRLALATGFYRLRLTPEDGGGVHRLLVRHAASTGAPRPLPSVARFVPLPVAAGEEVVVQFGTAPDDDAGLQLRRLPLDLGDAPAVTLDAGGTLRLPVQVAGAGELRTRALTGSLQLSTADGVWRDTLALPAGRHLLEVHNPGPVAVQAQLEFQRPPSAAPDLPVASEFARLVPGAVQALQLPRDARQLLRVTVPEDGLYSIESAGLLDTAARLHAPLQPDLLRAADGGSGRNFRLRGHLHAGDYLLEVRSRGASAGAATVSMRKAALHEAAALHPGDRLALSLDAGSGVQVDLLAPQAGRYRVAAMGVGHRYAVALADAQGWPLLRPGTPGEVVLDLAAGRHRMQVWPEPLDAALLLRFEALAERPRREGHGPHRLALNEEHTHRWMQPPADASRRDAVPGQDAALREDVWVFRLGAPASVSVHSSAEMAGHLHGADGAVLGAVSPFAPWRGQLDAGAYSVRLAHLREANRVDYRVSVEVEELLPGEAREIEAPAALWLSVPGGSVRVRSSGDTDVQAELLDADGAVLARADDDGADWNFRIEQTLPAGRYRLRVLPVGTEAVATSVRLESLAGAQAGADTGGDIGADTGVVARPESGATAGSDSGARAPDLTPPAASSPGDAAALGPGARVALQVPGGAASLALTLTEVSGPGLLWARSRAAPATLRADTPLATALDGAAVLAWADAAPVGLSVAVDGPRAASVELHRHDLRALPALALTGPLARLQVPAGSALPVTLAPGARRLQLDLPAGLVVLADDATLATSSARRYTLLSRATRLWLLNPQVASAQMVLASAPRADRVLGGSDLVRVELNGPGRLRLTGPDELPPGRLQVLGPVRDVRELRAANDAQAALARADTAPAAAARPLGAAGAPASATAAPAAAGPALAVSVAPGVAGQDDGRRLLDMAHAAGTVVVWGEGAGSDPWQDLAGAVAGGQQGTRLIGAAGGALALDALLPGLLRIAADAALLLRLRQAVAGVPAQAGTSAAGWTQHALLTPGAEVFLALPAGSAELALRPLHGPARTDWSISAALPLTEGLGPPAWLGPGAAAAYAFDLTSAGTVGLGVRSTTGAGSARLLDGAGRLLGSGLTQMHELAAGAYLLVVENPADAPPQALRAALVGTRPPGVEPPLEVVRRYLAGTGLAPAQE